LHAFSVIRLIRLILLPSVIVLSTFAPARAQEETVGQALCRLIESSAANRHLPLELFTRLIWRESSFKTGVISPAGAQGVAQFMPRTASARGLADPFDPEQAIPASAALLSDLIAQFGNFGLAAAAYNAGPTRLANWLTAKGSLPQETRDFIRFITGRNVEDWARDKAGREEQSASPPPGAAKSCLELAANLRKGVPAERIEAPAAFAPWGVQLAGNFSKERALATYIRARQHYASIIGELQPMVIGTRLRSRGTRAFYRIRIPAQSRAGADALCNRIHGVGGACVVLRT
jgi:hypothetical protein